MLTRRIGTLLAVAVALLGFGQSGRAQTWNNFTGVGVNWSVGTNWVGGVAPVSLNTTILTFGSTPSQVPPTSAFQPTGNYATSNDSATAFILNQMIFNGTGANDVGSNGIVINSTVAGGGISFQGTNPTITQNGTGSVAFANSTATADLQLTADGLTINGTGSGHLNLNGVMTGGVAATNILNINHTGASPMSSGSQIFINPAAASTFQGNTVLTSGNLTLNTTNSPLGAAANSLIIDGGTLRGSSAFALANNVVLNSQMRFVGITAPIFTGVISGNGGIFFNPSSGMTGVFQNAISGNGAILVEATGPYTPTFTLNSSASLNGTATSAASYTFNQAAFTISNTTATTTRLNSAAALTLNGSALNVTAGTAGPTSESVASTTVSGNAVFNLTPVATQPVTFTGGTLTRNNNATLFVTTPTGTTLGGTPGAAGNATLTFSNLSAGDNINGVLPFGFANTFAGGTQNSTLVRYDATNGIVPLDRNNDYTLSTNVHPYVLPASPTANYRVVSTANSFGASTNNLSVNALLFETPSAAGTIDGGLYGTGTISLTSGVLATSLVGGTTNPTFVGTVISKNIAVGSATGQFQFGASATLLGNVTGSNGLVKSGSGPLQLLGDNSGLTGGLFVNGGQLQWSRDANLGAPGAGVTIGQGAITANFIFTPNSIFESSNIGSVNINRPLTINSGAGLFSVNGTGTRVIWDGQVGGSGRLVKSFLGTLELTNAANNYTGDTAILQGTVVVSSDGALGAGGNIVFGSTSTANGAGVLQLNSSFSTNRNILLTTTTAAANFLFTNGSTTAVTWNGHIGGNQTGMPFNKIGAGELILTANNTVNGAYTQGEGPGSVRHPGAAFAQPGGTVTLNGANGALSAGTSYTLNLGSTLHLDNSANVNQNRVASKQVTLVGAEFKMTGNASQDVYEHIGVSSSVGLTNSAMGNTITLTQPVSAMTDKVTTLVATSYQTSAATGIAFFRGTNLGGATGDRTSMIFVASPTLLNNVLPQAFYANSPTADPQDFATITANAVQPFTGYVALPASGSVGTSTYSHTGSLTLTGAATVNALKLTNGTIDMGPNNISIGSATQSGLLLSTGTADLIQTTAAGVIDLAFGTQAARISVANGMAIGSSANPVRVTGSGGLHKFGSGNLFLSSSNITGGGYQVSGGTLTLLNPAAFTSGQTTTIAPGATFSLDNNGTPAAPIGITALQGFGTVAIGSGALATGSAVTSYGGALTGNGTLLNTGTNIQTLNGNSPNFSGGVQILAGGITVDTDVIPSNVTSPGALGTGTSAVQLGNTSGSAATTLTLGALVTRFERDIVVPAGSTGLPRILTNTSQITTMSGNIGLARELRLDGVGSSTTFTVGATTISGVISDNGGTGSLDWFGGSYNLWGNNTYSGRTFINAFGKAMLGIGHDNAFGTGTIVVDNATATGTLRADNGARTIANAFQVEAGTSSFGFAGQNDLTFTGNVDFGNGLRTIEFVGTGITTFSGNFTEAGGAASLTKTGGGTLVLSGQNTFSGGVIVNGGTLGFGSSTTGGPVTAGPVGTGTLTLGAIGSTLQAVGGSRQVDNPVTVSGDFAVNGSNNLTLGGAMSLGTAVRRVVVTNSGSTTFSGQIAATAGGINKDGPGVLNVTGDNLYTSGTTVTAGTLLVNNLTGSGTGTAAVSVLTGATLGGNGTIAGATTHQSGSFLSPGNSVGKLNFGSSLDLNTGSTYVWEMNGYTPVDAGGVNNGLSTDLANHDQAGVAGAFTGGNFSLKISELGTPTFTVGQTYSWTIATGSGTPTVGTVGFDLSTAPTFNAFGGASALSVTVALGQVNLNFTPVPEPATILGLSAGAFAIGGLIRRRFKKTTAV